MEDRPDIVEDRVEPLAAGFEEEPAAGRDPERAARRRGQTLDANVGERFCHRAEATVLEERDAAEGARPEPAVVAERERGHLVRRQSLFGAVAVEAVAVVPVEAVLGGDPEKAFAILRDGEDREVLQPLLAAVAAEGEASRRLRGGGSQQERRCNQRQHREILTGPARFSR